MEDNKEKILEINSLDPTNLSVDELLEYIRLFNGTQMTDEQDEEVKNNYDKIKKALNEKVNNFTPSQLSKFRTVLKEQKDDIKNLDELIVKKASEHVENKNVILRSSDLYELQELLQTIKEENNQVGDENNSININETIGAINQEIKDFEEFYGIDDEHIQDHSTIESNLKSLENIPNNEGPFARVKPSYKKSEAYNINNIDSLFNEKKVKDSISFEQLAKALQCAEIDKDKHNKLKKAAETKIKKWSNSDSVDSDETIIANVEFLLNELKDTDDYNKYSQKAQNKLNKAKKECEKKQPLKNGEFEEVSKVLDQIVFTGDLKRFSREKFEGKDDEDMKALFKDQVRLETIMYLANTNNSGQISEEDFKKEFIDRLYLGILKMHASDEVLKGRINSKNPIKSFEKDFLKLVSNKEIKISRESLVSYHAKSNDALETAKNRISLKQGYTTVSKEYKDNISNVDKKCEKKHGLLYKLGKTVIISGGWGAAYSIGAACGPIGVAVVGIASFGKSVYDIRKDFKKAKGQNKDLSIWSYMKSNPERFISAGLSAATACLGGLDAAKVFADPSVVTIAQTAVRTSMLTLGFSNIVDAYRKAPKGQKWKHAATAALSFGVGFVVGRAAAGVVSGYVLSDNNHDASMSNTGSQANEDPKQNASVEDANKEVSKAPTETKVDSHVSEAPGQNSSNTSDGGSITPTAMSEVKANETQLNRLMDVNPKAVNEILGDGWKNSAELHSMMEKGEFPADKLEAINKLAMASFDENGKIINTELKEFYEAKARIQTLDSITGETRGEIVNISPEEKLSFTLTRGDEVFQYEVSGKDGYTTEVSAKFHDSEGNVLGVTHTNNQTGEKEVTYLWENKEKTECFDSQGRSTKVIYTEDGKTVETSTTEYHENGVSVKTNYDSDGKATDIYKYTKNEDGSLSKVERDYNGDGKTDVIAKYATIDGKDIASMETENSRVIIISQDGNSEMTITRDGKAYVVDSDSLSGNKFNELRTEFDRNPNAAITSEFKEVDPVETKGLEVLAGKQGLAGIGVVNVEKVSFNENDTITLTGERTDNSNLSVVINGKGEYESINFNGKEIPDNVINNFNDNQSALASNREIYDKMMKVHEVVDNATTEKEFGEQKIANIAVEERPESQEKQNSQTVEDKVNNQILETVNKNETVRLEDAEELDKGYKSVTTDKSGNTQIIAKDQDGHLIKAVVLESDGGKNIGNSIVIEVSEDHPAYSTLNPTLTEDPRTNMDLEQKAFETKTNLYERLIGDEFKDNTSNISEGPNAVQQEYEVKGAENYTDLEKDIENNAVSLSGYEKIAQEYKNDIENRGLNNLQTLHSGASERVINGESISSYSSFDKASNGYAMTTSDGAASLVFDDEGKSQFQTDRGNNVRDMSYDEAKEFTDTINKIDKNADIGKVYKALYHNYPEEYIRSDTREYGFDDANIKEYSEGYRVISYDRGFAITNPEGVTSGIYINNDGNIESFGVVAGEKKPVPPEMVTFLENLAGKGNGTLSNAISAKATNISEVQNIILNENEDNKSRGGDDTKKGEVTEVQNDTEKQSQKELDDVIIETVDTEKTVKEGFLDHKLVRNDNKGLYGYKLEDGSVICESTSQNGAMKLHEKYMNDFINNEDKYNQLPKDNLTNDQEEFKTKHDEMTKKYGFVRGDDGKLNNHKQNDSSDQKIVDENSNKGNNSLGRLIHSLSRGNVENSRGENNYNENKHLETNKFNPKLNRNEGR